MTDNELRNFKRAPFVFPVRISQKNDENTFSEKYFHAFSDNISFGGIKIKIKKKFEKDEELLLRFDLIIDEQVNSIETKATIKWVTNLKNGFMEYGILFTSLTKDSWNILQRFMTAYCIE
ncbi:MAG: hypothetical protein ACD_79C01381G0005 [uncultured bacterium]|nr:MAG: hypothetical protein ACD_79C01381G0005 [uncultured bacterium]